MMKNFSAIVQNLVAKALEICTPLNYDILLLAI